MRIETRIAYTSVSVVCCFICIYRLWFRIPVAGNGHVTRDSETEDNIGKAEGVAVTQIENPAPIDADRVDTVLVPIADDRLISREPVIQGNICETRLVRVLKENDPIGRPEDTGRILSIAVPIARNPHIADIT